MKQPRLRDNIRFLMIALGVAVDKRWMKGDPPTNRPTTSQCRSLPFWNLLTNEETGP
jgi:hypothetical protein